MVILEANTSWDPGPRWVQPCKAGFGLKARRIATPGGPPDCIKGSMSICRDVVGAGKGRG